MRFLEIHLDGFGQLINRTFAFAPGLNLIYGPNEVGKSTLHQALLVMLYGFFDEGSITAGKRARFDAKKPWDTRAQYGGWLSYALGDSRQFKVTRTFHPTRSSTKLVTLPDQRDVTNEYEAASNGRLFFFEKQIGMRRHVFENTCTIRQSEIITLEEAADAIAETLSRHSSSGNADVTVSAALALLEAMEREDIGTLRMPSKPLAQTNKARGELDKRQIETRAKRAELWRKIAERNQWDEKLADLEQQRDELNYLQAKAELGMANAQLSATEKLAEKVRRRAEEMGGLAVHANFPAALHSKVIAADAGRQQLQSEVENASQRVAQEQDAAVHAQQQMAVLQKQIALLSTLPQIETDQIALIERLEQAWQQARVLRQAAREEANKRQAVRDETRRQLALYRTNDELLAIGNNGLAQIQQAIAIARQRFHAANERLAAAKSAWSQVAMDETQFLALERTAKGIQMGKQPAPPPKRGCNFFARGPAAETTAQPSERVLYEQVAPLRQTWLQAERSVEQAGKDLQIVETDARRMLRAEPTTTLDMAVADAGAKLTTYLRLEAQLAAHEQMVSATVGTLAHLTDEEAKAGDTLLAALHKHGVAGASVDDALTAYHAAEDAQSRLQPLLIEKERLLSALRDVQYSRAELESKRKSLEQADNELLAILASAGVHCRVDRLDDGVHQFRIKLAQYRDWETAKHAYDEAVRHQQETTNVLARTSSVRSIADLEAHIQATLSIHPEWQDQEAAAPYEEYVSRVKILNNELAQGREQRIRHQDAIDRLQANMMHLAEIDEESALISVQVRRLERFGELLATAATELRDAAQQYQHEFAPRLSAELSKDISVVTNGRYHTATVSPATLDVTMHTAESQSPVPSALLSSGTRDVVYLLLRLCLTQLMSESGEVLPILLDDPLVHVDNVRMQSMLTQFATVAGQRQVLLFTKEDRTREWFQQRLSGSESHRLLDLSLENSPALGITS